MAIACALVFVSGGFPLWAAWRANRGTVLVHTLGWTVGAWLAWIVALAFMSLHPEAGALRYLALCLTGCAMVAVLGARQPGAAAWNLVVAGLLTVLLLPLAELLIFRSPWRLEWFRAVLLGGVLAVGIVNYLPTRLGPAALVLTVGCTLELLRLTGSLQIGPAFDRGGLLGCFVVALSLWVGFTGMRKRGAAISEFDQAWHGFRDRFGLVWGQRLREQFNRSAANAGWPVVLTWSGLRRRPGMTGLSPVSEAALLATLRALMKRFGSPAEVASSEGRC